MWQRIERWMARLTTVRVSQAIERVEALAKHTKQVIAEKVEM